MAVNAEIIKSMNLDTLKKLAADFDSWAGHFGRAASDAAMKTIPDHKMAHHCRVMSQAALELHKGASRAVCLVENFDQIQAGQEVLDHNS